MKPFILLYSLLLLAESAPAQERGRNALDRRYGGVMFGSALASYREDLIVPLGFHGPGISFAGLYTRRTENTALNIRLKLGLDYTRNRYSHPTWALSLEARPSLVRKLADHQKFGKLFGGLSIPLQMNNLFFESWDDAHLYWLTSYSMAIAAEWQKRISGEFSTLIRTELPVLGWVSRPSAYRYEKQEALTRPGYHFTKPNESMHFETLDDYRSLFLQLLFRREAKHALIAFGFEFQYLYCREPEEIRSMRSSILFSYQWRIGS